ncbi:MAG: response regulator [Fibrobacterales bacterium]
MIADTIHKSCPLQCLQGGKKEECKYYRTTNVLLVAEDDKNSQLQLSEILEPSTLIFADSGYELLLRVKKTVPDIIILDYNMPGMTGLEVCLKLKADPETVMIPVVLITADTDFDLREIAFASGCEDFISKPLIPGEVKARIDKILQNRLLLKKLECRNVCLNEKLVEQQLELNNSHLATIRALGKLTESRDDSTGEHIERVQYYCQNLADKYPHIKDADKQKCDFFSECIFHASCLHDIGKVAISDAILKKPGPLTNEEFESMKTHSEAGYQALLEVHLSYPHNQILEMAMDISRYHHEKWDGSGYPLGKSGADIPLSARIMALADVYDALRSQRCYKEAFSHEKAVAIIQDGIGNHFDPLLTELFLGDHIIWDTIFQSYMGARAVEREEVKNER